jgi:DNA (cytosine-5)-methyltransferase 1
MGPVSATSTQRSPSCSKFCLWLDHLQRKLSIGNVGRFVLNAAFNSFRVEGYDDPLNPNVTVFIQPKQGKGASGYNVCCRLRVPGAEYENYHRIFLWIATFGKHSIDYLGYQLAGAVQLQHFRTNFFDWLSKRFGGHLDFIAWHEGHYGNDIRQDVNAYLGFLYNQVANLGDDYLFSHQVWADCGSTLERLRMNPEPTTVTPFVHSFFKRMYFAT